MRNYPYTCVGRILEPGSTGQCIILPLSLRGKKLHITAHPGIADRISSLFPALLILQVGKKIWVEGLNGELTASDVQELGDYSSTKGSGSTGAHSCQHSPGAAHRTPGLTSLDYPGKSLTHQGPWFSLSPLKNIFPYGNTLTAFFPCCLHPLDVFLT